MISVYTFRSDREISPSVWRDYLDLLPGDMADRAMRYRRWQDRQNNLFGNLLIWYGLKAEGFEGDLLSRIEKNGFGKPHIPGCTHFNVTHSGTVVACAFLRDEPVGLDIECIEPIDFGDFESYFDLSEWERIRSAPEPLTEFFRFWTKKESVIKADGRGLSVPLTSIPVSPVNTCVLDGKTYRIVETEVFDNYPCAWATVGHYPFEIKHLDLSDLSSLKHL